MNMCIFRGDCIQISGNRYEVTIQPGAAVNDVLTGFSTNQSLGTIKKNRICLKITCFHIVSFFCLTIYRSMDIFSSPCTKYFAKFLWNQNWMPAQMMI